ncbi:putative protein phosphatase 2C 78 [Acorus calamus]|uniref:protein-serine/threonine phosphatase n=1 Tax=Acorus calamus TaxID=4465 RepID=A0AAV9D3P9_ACOCL|nr:putative protein phosphatase 2C 78 [Acorus calamus]
MASVGSCCLVGVIDGDMLYVANLGDSRAVLGRKSDGGGLEDSKMEVVAERMSTDHNVAAEEVRKEVVELHPVEERVGTYTRVSRFPTAVWEEVEWGPPDDVWTPLFVILHQINSSSSTEG